MLLEQLEAALIAAKMKITRYDPSKTRCLTFSSGGTLSFEKFCQKFPAQLGADTPNFPKVIPLLYDADKMLKAVHDYCKEKKILKEEAVLIVPPEIQDLRLNMDVTHPGREGKFFLTDKKEFISAISGASYLKIMQMQDIEATSQARHVVPEYQPRQKQGVSKRIGINEQEDLIFNSYIPPSWMRYDKPLPDKLPRLFEKLVNHLFPDKLEREYFFSWLHDSLFNRAYVYLVLCGAPAAGKNRLKLVLRALHGHQNAVDGKKSTLKERFNSQLAEATIAWFDELHYEPDMENAMKEIQNDTISIERKGIDATRSTKIYSSLVISNNKPRDNYIPFDARKFAPLQVTRKRLDTAMTAEEIGLLTAKVEDWSAETFDVAFIAQIGRWVKKHGRSKKWPHLEYKGPMFYRLAHTSMSRWQKRAASTVLTLSSSASGRIATDPKKGFKWSSIEESVLRKADGKGMQFPDYSTVKYFFDIFVDGEGKKTFETSNVPKDIMGDFYVKVINLGARILTEADVTKTTGGDNVEEDDYSDAL